jgi:hypothetical protein
MWPNVAGFQTFLTNVVQVPSAALPSDAPIITYAFDFALATVNLQLSAAWAPPGSWTPFQMAVYSLATDLIINWAQDPSGEPPIYGPDGNQPYFKSLRAGYGTSEFVAGVIQSSGDQGTSQSFVVPKQFEGLTIGQLTNLKTPYGRQYLSLTQSIGTLWGLN